MADENGTTSRPRKRTCVALADNAPDDADRDGTVVVGKCISDGVVKRSALLSGVVDAEGLASLPGHISPEDVRLWETACLVGNTFPTDELVTVLKVADALGDDKESVGKWLRILAQRAVETDWQQQPQAAATLTSLLRLPDHLLRDAMAACADRASLSNLLTSFPHCLHPHILLSAVCTDGTLDIPREGAPKALAFLPLTVFPPPGLQGLVINMDAQEQGSSGETSAVPALLARAAAAHPTLTSLRLASDWWSTGISLPPRWLHTLAAGLPPGALPRLADLRLRIACRPDACAELVACLRHLPALTSLTVGLAVSPGPVSDVVSLKTYSGLGAAPASLPQLHHLCIDEEFDQALSDRRLQHDVPRTGFPPLLSLISAPSVTKLMLMRSPMIPSLRQLVSRVERFEHLKELHLSVLLGLDDPFLSCAGGVFTRLKGLGQLPALETATVGGGCPASPVFIAAAVATLAAASLTSLTLGLGHSDTHDAVEYSEGIEGTVSQALSGWVWLSKALCRCSAVRALSVEALGCGRGPRFSIYLGRALSHLLQLQHLTLTPVDSALPMLLDEEFVRALARLTALETLAFEQWECGSDGREGPMRFTFPSVTPVLRAIGKLKRLTELQLFFDGVTRPLLAELLEELPALKSVCLLSNVLADGRDPMPDHEIVAWEALTQRFPCVGIGFQRV